MCRTRARQAPLASTSATGIVCTKPLPGPQLAVDVQHFAGQSKRVKQVAKRQDRRLVGWRDIKRFQIGKAAHRLEFVQRVPLTKNPFPTPDEEG